MLDTTIQLSTDHFEGPLGLLLHLIQKEEMSVKDLDLQVITRQYLDYLAKMQALDFDYAGDYLYLAATLILLKSKQFIDEEDQDLLKNNLGVNTDMLIVSEADLINRLEELQYFKRMASLLVKLPQKNSEIFVRPKISKKKMIQSLLPPMELNSLIGSMMDFLEKERRKYKVVRRDRLSIKEKLQFLKDVLNTDQRVEFDDLLEMAKDRSIENIVISFISILELARLKKVTFFQNELKGPIYIDVIENMKDLDVDSANGFDEESANQMGAQTSDQEQISDQLAN